MLFKEKEWNILLKQIESNDFLIGNDLNLSSIESFTSDRFQNLIFFIYSLI